MEETTFPLQCVTKVIGLETLDSTQDLAYELAQKGEPDGTLVLACEQTAARCQDGRAFSAGEGGVYFTLILRPQKKDLCAQSLCLQAAQAAADMLADMFGVKTKVKAPNAVLAWDTKTRKWKKIAGVLVETFFDEDNRLALVGMGVNVNNRLPASLKDKAVSLKQLIGAETSKELFLDELLNVFWKHYAQWNVSVR